VITGLALTAVLALLALVQISFFSIGFRSPPIYTAKSTLFVTQSGFPWGRSSLTEYVQARGAGDKIVSVARFAEPSRMEYLASLYSELARSDSVRSLITRGNGNKLQVGEDYTVVPLAPDGRPLPLIEITGTSGSPTRAVSLANRAALALQTYVCRSSREPRARRSSRVSSSRVRS
jgi:hypothetical protein